MTSALLPSPTVTPAVEPTAPLSAESPLASACDAALSRSRLQVGTNVTILRRLNFRSSPDIRDNWLLTNIPGTRVELIGGPECLPYRKGAYTWWQIRLPNGRVGWSAEGSLHGRFISWSRCSRAGWYLAGGLTIRSTKFPSKTSSQWD